MRGGKTTSQFFLIGKRVVLACGLFVGALVPLAEGRLFTEIHVGKWIPTGQDVIVGVIATLPNTCTLFDEMETDMVPPVGQIPGQLNIRVTLIPAPYNIEPEGAIELGCRNETHYIYEKVNFGQLENGPYEVRVYENGTLSIKKLLNVSEFPIDPIFSDPGGFYNIGEAKQHEALIALHE
jgi:hypothetical protein